MIIDEVKNILKEISKSHTKINGTMEIQNKIVSFTSTTDFNDNDKKIVDYYDNTIMETWTKRHNMEKDHYLFLEYALKHKIKEVQYFFKTEDITSRKFIVFSGDCINCIDMLFRGNIVYINVFMRSSDCLRLLPMDIIECIRIAKNVCNYFCYKHDKIVATFFITSCHYYLSDTELVRSVLK